MASTHLSLQIRPHVDEARLYDTVDAAIEVILDSGLPHRVGAMETTIEGELDELLALVARVHRRCIELGATRVGASINIDHRPAGLSFDEKLSRHRAPRS